MRQKSGERCQESGIRGRRSEEGAEIGGQRKGQRSEVRGQRSEVGKTKDDGQEKMEEGQRVRRAEGKSER
jgi:hypothetical protein